MKLPDSSVQPATAAAPTTAPRSRYAAPGRLQQRVPRQWRGRSPHPPAAPSHAAALERGREPMPPPGRIVHGQRLPPLGMAQAHTPRFCRRQGGDGAGADLVALMLRKRGQHVKHQLVCMGIIDRHELHAAFHQPGDESDVAGQPVKLRDDQHRPLTAAQIERGRQLRPIILPAALDLCELCQQITPARDEADDRRALRIEAKAALSLAGGGGAVASSEKSQCNALTAAL